MDRAVVALAGEGADEVFGGYSYYRDVLRRGRSSARRLIDNAEPVTPSGFPLLTDATGRRRLLATRALSSASDALASPTIATSTG